METGRVIYRRYLLKRLIKQGPNSAVYQGIDQVLQRPVAVKSVPATHAPAYRAALRLTAQFSHPNIIGLYDLITEGENLYVVQEYIEGDDFPTLLQKNLAVYEIIDLGCQLCKALIYASTGSRRASHGDLTSASVLRDIQGFIRVNNFGLPSDQYYFNSWCVVGGAGVALQDTDLPWGQQSDARRDDDTRAVGLLLYQLLAGRAQGANSVEPPMDGRLRFMRNIPPELCEAVARAVIREHPQHLGTPEGLYAELKKMADALEPAVPVVVGYPQEELVRARQFSPVSSPLATAGNFSGRLGSGDYRSGGPAPLVVTPTVADASLKMGAVQNHAYERSLVEPTQRQSTPLVLLLVMGLVLFGLFFAAGYVLSTLFIH